MSKTTQDEQKAQLFASQQAKQLTREEAVWALRLREILFLAYNFPSGYTVELPETKGHNLEQKKGLDTDFLLTIMIRAYNNDPDLFPTDMTNTEKILEEVLLSRRAVAHGFLPLILQRGEDFLSSWIAVATLLNHQEEADKLQSIFDHVYAGLPDLRGDRECPYSKLTSLILL